MRGVTGSGDSAIVSSSGFYVDDTPPVFDPEVMSAAFYYDVGQGESTPVQFQQSNDTIKCIWKCDDEESGIVVRKYLSFSRNLRLYSHIHNYYENRIYKYLNNRSTL